MKKKRTESNRGWSGKNIKGEVATSNQKTQTKRKAGKNLNMRHIFYADIMPITGR
jgi:hypothetical protein